MLSPGGPAEDGRPHGPASPAASLGPMVGRSRSPAHGYPGPGGMSARSGSSGGAYNGAYNGAYSGRMDGPGPGPIGPGPGPGPAGLGLSGGSGHGSGGFGNEPRLGGGLRGRGAGGSSGGLRDSAVARLEASLHHQQARFIKEQRLAMRALQAELRNIRSDLQRTALNGAGGYSPDSAPSGIPQMAQPALSGQPGVAVTVFGAGGVGIETNGEYRVSGTYGGRPKYQQIGGESIIYFRDSWKVYSRDDTGGWYYSAPLDSPEPPTGRWSTEGYSGYDADPSPVITNLSGAGGNMPPVDFAQLKVQSDLAAETRRRRAAGQFGTPNGAVAVSLGTLGDSSDESEVRQAASAVIREMSQAVHKSSTALTLLTEFLRYVAGPGLPVGGALQARMRQTRQDSRQDSWAPSEPDQRLQEEESVGNFEFSDPGNSARNHEQDFLREASPQGGAGQQTAAAPWYSPSAWYAPFRSDAQVEPSMNRAGEREPVSYYKVVSPEGVVVRRGLDLTSEPVTNLPFGTTFEVVEHALNQQGIVRLRTVNPEGWTSARGAVDDRFLVERISGGGEVDSRAGDSRGGDSRAGESNAGESEFGAADFAATAEFDAESIISERAESMASRQSDGRFSAASQRTDYVADIDELSNTASLITDDGSVRSTDEFPPWGDGTPRHDMMLGLPDISEEADPDMDEIPSEANQRGGAAGAQAAHRAPALQDMRQQGRAPPGRGYGTGGDQYGRYADENGGQARGQAPPSRSFSSMSRGFNLPWSRTVK